MNAAKGRTARNSVRFIGKLPRKTVGSKIRTPPNGACASRL
jgi:hypothetical protein